MLGGSGVAVMVHPLETCGTMAGRGMADKWGGACQPAGKARSFVRFWRIISCALLPCPALADQILAASQVTAVTIYPQGAQVTREVTFTAPAGQHELLITDLPSATQPELIRLGSETAQLGAFSLRTDRPQLGG